MSMLRLYLKRLQQHMSTITQRSRPTPFDITVFLRQLATLIAAGIPLVECCTLLEKSQEKIALRLLIYTIKNEMLSGKNLSASLKAHADYFDSFTIQLVEIGEHTGRLHHLLLTIAHYHEKQLAFKNKVKQALFYPCLMLAAAIIVMLILIVFVIPRFAELFHDIQDKLPPLTRGIFYVATGLEQHLGLFSIGLLVILLASIKIFTSPKLKSHLQHSITQLPFIKSCRHKIICARFARNLSITFAAGIAITTAMKLAARVSVDEDFRIIVANVRNNISAGLQLHQAMRASHYFPLLMVQMIKIGEESGMLEAMLNKIADFFEDDIERNIATLNQLLEPLIMLVLGVLIGGLVIGMYLPIFKLGSTL